MLNLFKKAKSTSKSFDVGILGWWYGKNYGSIMTYYGLNRAIESLGHKVLMVHEPLGYNGYRVKWPDDILSMEFARRVGYECTPQVHYSTLPSLNETVKTFVVGSDQLWNPLIGRVNDDLFLDFVSPENRRVAYATSFGNRGIDKFKPPFIEKHKKNLQAFSAISVRENYAINTARDVFGVDATQVVDPVFLLDTAHYLNLANGATVKPSGKYMAVFFLDPTPEKRDVIVRIADKLGFDKIVVIPNPDNGQKRARDLFKGDRYEIIGEDAPENFLYAYSQASYVVTDSFHGSAFSVIFGKPFSSIYNTKRGADRFKSLMTSLGFGEKRRVLETDTTEVIAANPNVSLEIDYTAANKYIEEGRKASMDWLAKAMAGQSTGRGLFSAITGGAKTVSTKDKIQAEVGDQIVAPTFASNNNKWSVKNGDKVSTLDVSADGAVKGNLVWCDLPFVPEKGAAYRLTVKWTPRTAGRNVAFHLRNPETGKFTVVGAVPAKDRKGSRVDQVEFRISADGYSQFMLGAVHFLGANAGAEVESIALLEIAEVTTQSTPAAAPAKKGPTHAEVAMQLSIDDANRFAKTHLDAARAKDIGACRARLMFHAHAIEKGLSRTDFRTAFGKISVPALANEMNAWLKAGRDVNDQFFRTAASVMNAYFGRHTKLRSDVTVFRSLFDKPVQAIIDAAENPEGGVLEQGADREKFNGTVPERNFLDVIYSRRSVREFTGAPVADADIEKAVQIAMQAPSVCNRQAARVHVIEDPKKIKAALDIQGGFGGYPMPPKLLLVTSDLRAFLFAAERNQPFVDGGLFMMTLLLGLEQVGLGSCSLNTAMHTDRATKIRGILDIPENEVFISFIAVGHYDPKILTPKSTRIAVENVIVKHGRG